MATIERRLKGSFDSLLQTLEREIVDGNVSATFHGGSNFVTGGVRCAVRVYERYSIMGKGRMSATVTLFGVGEDLSLSIIAAGGSQAMFFKVNTWSESGFAEDIARIVDRWQA